MDTKYSLSIIIYDGIIYTNIRFFVSPSLLSSSLVDMVALDTTLSFCLDDNTGPFLLLAD